MTDESYTTLTEEGSAYARSHPTTIASSLALDPAGAAQRGWPLGHIEAAIKATNDAGATEAKLTGLDLGFVGFSDGMLAIQNRGQDIAHVVFVDRQTATDEAAEAHWRPLTDEEKQGIIDQIARGLGCVERPPFPADAVCECGGEDWQIVEDGYMRWTSATIERVAYDDGVNPDSFSIVGHPDGWDDMSEDGTDQWMACQSCGKTYDMAGIDIDYS